VRNKNYLGFVALALCVTSVQSLAQGAKATLPAPAAAFLKESRALLKDLRNLQLSDAPTIGSVAKCVPKPPNPDGLCPPLCPPPSSMRALRTYSEGRAKNVAAAMSVGSVADGSWICDPGTVEKTLNDLVRRVDRIGNWVVITDNSGVTITTTPPATVPGQGVPELKPNAVRTRGFAALDYLNGELTQGRDPNIKPQ